jgi:glyoxylase-like metal-dependent hydrolase (beta-lactamase superfamily II)
MDLDRITDWLWCQRTPVVQAYAVRERDGFNLIDASTTGEEDAILRRLAALQSRARIYDILLTHGHDDHTGSAAALAGRTGARLIAASEEASVISGEHEAAPALLADWEIPLFAEVKPKVPDAPPVVPDLLVADGDRLGWQHEAMVLGTPGHTPGHISAWFERDRVLVAGDALASHEGKPMVGAFNANPEAAAATAQRLATLDSDIACFGHGAPLRHAAAARLADALIPETKEEVP